MFRMVVTGLFTGILRGIVNSRFASRANVVPEIAKGGTGVGDGRNWDSEAYGLGTRFRKAAGMSCPGRRVYMPPVSIFWDRPRMMGWARR